MAQGIDRFFLLLCGLACWWAGFNAASSLRVVRQWPELKFNFPSQEAEQTARAKQYYVPGNSVPIDVDVHYRQSVLSPRMFVTIPRFSKGRPVTLGTVDPQGRISGYPDYSWHDNQGRNCDGLTSVFRVAIDECKRLWVMDSGKISSSQLCPPQLLAFDLNTDQLIFRHVVNASSYVPSSLFVTPVVDVRGQDPNDCANTFVYVADAGGAGLLVVDVARQTSWRLTHQYFYPNPSRTTFTIQGESFNLTDGVLGMALSPLRCARAERLLYFHALASSSENFLSTRVLRDKNQADNPNLDPHSVYMFKDERSNQSAAEAMDRDGILYFGLMEPPSIWCWNTATDFSQRNFHQLAVNNETLQFAGGVKIVNNLKGEQELWVLTSSLQRFKTGSLSSDKINYRIHAEKIPSLIVNSPCKRLPTESKINR